MESEALQPTLHQSRRPDARANVSTGASEPSSGPQLSKGPTMDDVYRNIMQQKVISTLLNTDDMNFAWYPTYIHNFAWYPTCIPYMGYISDRLLVL